MSPVMNTCNLRCKWCWRDIEYTSPKWIGPVDDPEFIVDGCIEAHKKILMGYKGNSKIHSRIFEQVMKPKHTAISLFGEATNYPKLPGLIDAFHDRGITTFLVTNGTNPDMMTKLLESQPTQLYITLPAPNEYVFLDSCRPLVKDAWKGILKSVAMLKKFNCRKTIRFTLASNLNMKLPEEYAKILDGADADFYELKGFVWVGHSRNRLQKHQMPFHDEIKAFAEQIAHHANLKIVSEKPESRAILLMKESSNNRFLMKDERSREMFCKIR